MPRSVEEIMADAMELAPKDQDLLAWRLCATPRGMPDQAELDTLRLVEAKRRMAEIDSGAVVPLDGESVFAGLRRQVNDCI